MSDELSMAARIRFYRRRARLSQRELARRAGIGRMTLVALENGTQTQPNLGTLQAIADVCLCHVKDLIPDMEPALA
jgi:transcriptional regulator with XRE-family HTH domain